MEKLENFERSRRMLVFFPQPPKDSVKKHFAGKQFGTSFGIFEKGWAGGKHACLSPSYQRRYATLLHVPRGSLYTVSIV